MEDIPKKIQEFLTEFPEYIYLIIGVIFLVLFIGLIKDKNWAIDPEGGSQRLFYNWFGRRAFKIFIGFVYILGTLAGFGMFLFYFFQKDV